MVTTKDITLDTLDANNVSRLTTVELIDILYDHTNRVQVKTMHHLWPDEVLLEAYDDHYPNTLRDCNPRILALDAELQKRFQPLRSRLTPPQKRCMTNWLKDLDLVSLLAFTKDIHQGWMHSGLFPRTLLDTVNAVLALLLEPESKEACAVVRQKYNAITAKRDAEHNARMAERQKAATAGK
jgi:hypothetical protein